MNATHRDIMQREQEDAGIQSEIFHQNPYTTPLGRFPKEESEWYGYRPKFLHNTGGVHAFREKFCHYAERNLNKIKR
jgi:hypothetical protein